MKGALFLVAAALSASSQAVWAWTPQSLQTTVQAPMSILNPSRLAYKQKIHGFSVVSRSDERLRALGTNLLSAASAGGELESSTASMMTSDDQRSSSRGRFSFVLPSAQQLLSRALLMSLLVLGFSKRAAVLEFLDYIKNEWLMTTLYQLSGSGPKGLTIYSVFFCLWTMLVGVTTPVETAAGMAFGVKQGILASGSAKFLAALATFLLARHRFSETIRPAVEGNEVLSLMEESIQERPFQVALLCRFSPLPEVMKNAGMGVSPVKLRYFVASLVVHGISFTCLWTWMGAETARVLQGLPPSATLKYLLTAATWIGFAAPVCIGIWLKSLRDKREERRQQDPAQSTSP